MVTSPSCAATDAQVLYRELALRILMQNVLLMLSLVLFTAFAILAFALPAMAWAATAAHGAVGLGAVLQWCHHGIRTKQIKEYLLTIDSGQTDAWERWLPANRPSTLLGSRWMISTKGVFLGLQLAMIGLALQIAPVSDEFFASATMILLLANAGFLLTNPKE
jgi:hypothetical protein